MLETYVHDANAILYVYDVKEMSSFAAVQYWMREVNLVAGG